MSDDDQQHVIFTSTIGRSVWPRGTTEQYFGLLGQGASGYTYVEPQRQQSRTVFVGYPYRIPKDDYRPIFEAVGEEYNVTFVFADDELTSKHILEKIAGMIEAADFSLSTLRTGIQTLHSNLEWLTDEGWTSTSSLTRRKRQTTS